MDFLKTSYQEPTTNLWEEVRGASFFARSVQLRCFQAIAANALGIPIPAWLSTAIEWLKDSLQSHWNGEYYVSVLPVPNRLA